MISKLLLESILNETEVTEKDHWAHKYELAAAHALNQADKEESGSQEHHKWMAAYHSHKVDSMRYQGKPWREREVHTNKLMDHMRKVSKTEAGGASFHRVASRHWELP